mgnify:CR=1 FL=1
MIETTNRDHWVLENNNDYTQEQHALSDNFAEFYKEAIESEVKLKTKNLAIAESSSFKQFDLGLDDQESKISTDIPNPVRYNLGSNSGTSFRLSKQWIGHVESVTSEHIIAKIKDVRIKEEYQEAIIDLDEIDESDLELVEEGAAFYWSLGVEKRAGRTQNISEIRFQRLPNYSVEEFDEALDQGNYMKSCDW